MVNAFERLTVPLRARFPIARSTVFGRRRGVGGAAQFQ
jgi:hypothetical protein